MNFRSLPMQDFSGLLDGFLARKGKKAPADLLPSSILDAFAQLDGCACTAVEIEGWYAFEQCLEDWDTDKFKQVIRMEDFALDQSCYLITDEGYRQKEVFEFAPLAFPEFARWYESNFKMSFFQSADYLLFSGNFTKVRIIHHNGVLWKIDHQN